MNDLLAVAESSVGFEERTMILVAPWRLMSSRASCIEPSPKAMRGMTEAGPMAMPRMGGKGRGLCRQSAWMACIMPRTTLVGLSTPMRDGAGGGGMEAMFTGLFYRGGIEMGILNHAEVVAEWVGDDGDEDIAADVGDRLHDGGAEGREAGH